MTEPFDDAEECERERQEEIRDARASIQHPWEAERHDNRDGTISYEIWATWNDDGTRRHRICRITDDDNPTAKRDAEHIVKLHNASLLKTAKPNPI